MATGQALLNKFTNPMYCKLSITEVNRIELDKYMSMETDK